MRQREEAEGETVGKGNGTDDGRTGERERERGRPPSTTTYLYHGIVSSPHSSRCSTLPRLTANHHYLITRSFFVGDGDGVSAVRGGIGRCFRTTTIFVNPFYEAACSTDRNSGHV